MGCSRMRRAGSLLLPKVILNHAGGDGNALRNQIFLAQYRCIHSLNSVSKFSEFMFKVIFRELALCWSFGLESVWCFF